MAKIYLDGGHGGSDPGAVGNGLREKDLNLKIARYTRDYLRDNYNNANVRMSRTTDKTLSLGARTSDANSWGADIFVSVHCNAATSSATGYEDFIWNGSVSQATRNLQNNVHAEMAKVFKGFRNRGKKRANFYVLRNTRMPAVLIEALFITNRTDANFLGKDSNLKNIAKHLAIGIAKHQKLTAKKKTPTPSPGKTIYRVQIGAFSVKRNADNFVKDAKKKGFKDAYATKAGNLYRVQIGAFSVKRNADNFLKSAKAKGYKDAYITTK